MKAHLSVFFQVILGHIQFYCWPVQNNGHFTNYFRNRFDRTSDNDPFVACASVLTLPNKATSIILHVNMIFITSFFIITINAKCTHVSSHQRLCCIHAWWRKNRPVKIFVHLSNVNLLCNIDIFYVAFFLRRCYSVPLLGARGIR